MLALGTIAMAVALVAAACSEASASPAANPRAISARTGGAGSQATPSPSLGDLLTYDYGNTRSGEDPVGPAIKNLSGSPAWDDHGLDGAVYGEPLVYDATVYVATENDSLYAIAARSGKVLWREHVGTAVSTSVVDSAPTLNSGCGDINPLGITGTPVIDAATNEIFLAEETELAGQSTWSGIRHWLVAISLSSHQVLWHRDIDPPDPNTSGSYYIPAEQQRPAMTLANGRLYVDFGGLDGDCGQYHGYVVEVAVSGSRPARQLPSADPARRRRLGDERRGRLAAGRSVCGNGQRELQYDRGFRRGQLGCGAVPDAAAPRVLGAQQLGPAQRQ